MSPSSCGSIIDVELSSRGFCLIWRQNWLKVEDQNCHKVFRGVGWNRGSGGDDNDDDAVVSCTCFIARYPCCSFFICRSNYIYFLPSEFTYGHAAFPYRAIYLTDYERINQNFRSIIKDGGEDFAFGNCKQSCDIVLMNSCRAIEGKCIDYLSSLCQKKVVTVGPLATQPDSEEEYSEIMQWLSQKNQFSTVFISFGSENYLSKEQIEEMARGLELCDVNFIWVVRFPVGNTTRIEETLPEGFLDRVKERGIIV
ncbi:beta-D-glucosyl crocetin beta-1,6-glucosyltransferase-like [Olea europaea var. sylvestris]|uniref:beta-D-glucosyl crocetin beta-1,6-glucosyltransferase-like n=1 Tax=Olea europaea var. sylvestris TaxID=158386 RepID=UPI000C1D099A|nr:beta-D-glucosyl crocetin beta-1,6-glucosyltransferase-like [Olea europaea var. sylvestris]